MSAVEISEAQFAPVAPAIELRLSEPSISNHARHIKYELARELHDRVAQNLTAVLMQTQVFAREQQGRQDVLDQLAFVHTSVREVLNDVRQILCDLRGKPGLADDLVIALREGLLPTFGTNTAMTIGLWVSGAWPASLPPETCIHIYRIVQEALINARKHGGASQVHVGLRAPTERLVISIRDNGQGIHHLDPDRLIGMGILGMRERASLLGGTLAVTSGRAGGTTVAISIPREALHWSPKPELSGF